MVAGKKLCRFGNVSDLERYPLLVQVVDPAHTDHGLCALAAAIVLLLLFVVCGSSCFF